MFTTAAVGVIRVCLGPGFDELFAGMPFSGLIVPAWMAALDQASANCALWTRIVR